MSDFFKIIKMILVILLIILGYQNQETIIENTKDVINLDLSENKDYKFESFEIEYGLIEELKSNVEVLFCPKDECFERLFYSLNKSNEEIKCAFYEFDDMELSELLKEKSLRVNVSLIVDDKYLEEGPLLNLDGSEVKVYSDVKRGTRYNNYMHDKFCVIDDELLITGSMNPTENGMYKNNNNLLFIESKYLAKNYENEFEQMSSGIYGTNKKSVLEYNDLILKFEDESYNVSSFMCPQDDCEGEVIKILDSAENEILFATFAITNNQISSVLINKSEIGINVSGLIEKRNYNLKGSDVKEMINYFEIRNDTNKNTMHHKFFVVDEKYVITGSMNPSGSGVNYNDENILIIDNREIAKKYKNEFLNLIPTLSN